ncbi:hypothetical protein BDF19DRAFT_447157 [Syncephalis fuscata]|nr:hypothetical protein BDF19DRAFT_447157 [Syncephalis fuscata]
MAILSSTRGDASDSSHQTGTILGTAIQTLSSTLASTTLATNESVSSPAVTTAGMTVRLMTFNGHRPHSYVSKRQDQHEVSSSNSRSKNRHNPSWTPTPRDSLIRREYPGKPGSRRRQRYDNNHFVGHPCATLSPEDLPAPGYALDAPGFHFTDHAQVALSAPELPAIFLPSKIRSRPTRVGLTPGDRTLRQADFDAWTLLDHDILSEEEEEEEEPSSNDSDVDDQASSMVLVCEEDTQPSMNVANEVTAIDGELNDAITVTSGRRLVWEASDGLSRLIVHSICRHYRLHSYSKDTREGKRLTFIERRPDTVLPTSNTSFFDTLFFSSNMTY